jgi:O-antigen/teichoic acid export membrane protein
MGVDSFGFLVSAIAFVEVFVILTTNGIDAYAVNKISIDKKKVESVVNQILSLKVTAGFLAYCLLIAASFLFIDELVVQLLIPIIGLHVIGRGINGRWIYQGLEQMQIIAYRQLITSVLMVILLLLLINDYTDLYTAAFLFVGTEIFNTALTLIYYRNEGYRIELKFDFRSLSSLAKKVAPFTVFFLMVALYNYIDKIMILFIREDFAYINAVLQNSIQIMGIFLLPSAIIQHAYFPRFSSFKSIQSIKSTHLLYTRVMSFFMGFGIGTLLFLPETSLIIYPDEYQEMIDILPYFAIIVSLTFMVLHFTIPLMSQGFEKKLIMFTALSLILNVTLNAILIPDYGIYGAVVGTIIAELAMFISAGWYFRSISGFANVSYAVRNTLLSIIAFGSVTYLLVDTINIIFVLISAALVYILLALLTKSIDKEVLKTLSR